MASSYSKMVDIVSIFDEKYITIKYFVINILGFRGTSSHLRRFSDMKVGIPFRQKEDDKSKYQ